MARKKRPDGFPKVTLKNIHRPEPRFFGWRVNVKRRRVDNWRDFPDGPDGPFESLRAAIEWRDQLWAKLGPPLRGLANARNSSGVVGVSLEVQRLSSGRICESYVAKWLDADGKRHGRGFSLDKLGKAEALRLATAARRAGVAATRRVKQQRMLDALHIHHMMLRSKT